MLIYKPLNLMKFIYNGRIYNPSNLEKKLKKMGITINDIEIIPEKKKNDSGIEDYMLDKEQVIIRSTKDDIRRICYVKKGERPPIKDILNNLYFEEELMTMYYEN